MWSMEYFKFMWFVASISIFLVSKLITWICKLVVVFMPTNALERALLKDLIENLIIP
jgi:hypothetical protein